MTRINQTITGITGNQKCILFARCYFYTGGNIDLIDTRRYGNISGFADFIFAQRAFPFKYF
jgi:hypothetical protein